MKHRSKVLIAAGFLTVSLIAAVLGSGPKLYSDQQVFIKTINYTKPRNIQIDFKVPQDKKWYVVGVNFVPYQSGYLVKFVKCNVTKVCSSQVKASSYQAGTYRVQFPQDRSLWIREQRGELRLSPRVIQPIHKTQAEVPETITGNDYL